MAPGATITRTSRQRVTAVTLDVLLAVSLVLAIPFAFAAIAGLIQFAITAAVGR